MKGATLIPGSLMPLPPLDLEGPDARRITLLHKRKDVLACVMHRGLEELTLDKPVEDAFTINMYGPNHVSIRYLAALTASGRPVGKKAYTLLSKDDSVNITKVKIAFLRESNKFHDVVTSGTGLDEKMSSLLEVSNKYLITICEEIADRGFFRGLTFPSEKLKQIKREKTEIGASIYRQINALFGEEPSEEPVRKADLYVADRSLGNHILDPRKTSTRIKGLSGILLAAPLAAALLPAAFPDLFNDAMREQYKKRFDSISDEKEKEAIALSEFAACQPRMMSGLRRAYFEVKAVGDISTYALQLGLTSYAVANWSPWLSVPMALPTAITGLVKLKNALQSGGQDYSGVISSVFNYACNKKLSEERESE